MKQVYLDAVHTLDTHGSCTSYWHHFVLQPKREEPKKESTSSWSSQRSNSFDRSSSRSESRGERKQESSWNSQSLPRSDSSSRSRSQSPHEARLAQQKRIELSRAAKGNNQSSQSSYYNQNKNSFGTPEVSILFVGFYCLPSWALTFIIIQLMNWTMLHLFWCGSRTSLT